MTKIERQVRLSQTVVPFGVGAIYDFRGESLVGCDTQFWRGRGDPIDLPRLAKALGVDKLKSAPSIVGFQSADSAWRVPYVRFPAWLFCGTCRRMTRWNSDLEETGVSPKCERCPRRPQLIPMRFVVACEKGHLGDVYWDRWAHSRAETNEQKQCRERNLTLRTHGGGGVGLESLRVRCGTCGASRNLAGITSPDVARAAGITCPGKQPWQRMAERVDCDATPRVLQRGASNLYFARTESALDIPPHSDFDQNAADVLAIVGTNEFGVIKSSPTGPIARQLIAILAENFDTTIEGIEEILRQELGQEGVHVGTPSGDDLATEEWNALISPQKERHPRSDFISRDTALFDQAVHPVESEMDKLFDKVVLVNRLKEVRALVGFTRYQPDGEPVTPDLGKGVDFVPAVEVRGEGMFISFDDTRLRSWEGDTSVRSRVAQLEARRASSFLGSRVSRATPRFVLIHTFAHVLIRQLSFESGYPVASLRERVDAREPGEDGGPQAGVLIYTAAGDMEGTLGGLVRMGEAPHLSRSILAALESSAWCSTDPICAESLGQGFAAMNFAACHACGLLPETSCQFGNLLLDRGLLVGTSSFSAGFFSQLVAAALDAAAEAEVG